MTREDSVATEKVSAPPNATTADPALVPEGIASTSSGPGNPGPTRHGEEFWEPLIREWRQSELTQETFCRQKAVSLMAFQRWGQRLRARERRARESGGGDGDGGSSSGGVNPPTSPFVPVALRGVTMVAENSTAPFPGAQTPAPLELLLLGGRRVLRIRAAVPESLLLLVIRAAEAAAAADNDDRGDGTSSC